MLKQRTYVYPTDKSLRVIIDTDCKCEADDQYAVVHGLLTPKFDVRAVIAEQFGGRTPDDEQASYDEIVKLTELMGIPGEVNILHGGKHAMPDDDTPVDSEGARFIIDEARRDDPRPLFVCCQGAVTNLASALLLAPDIADRLTVVWIGGVWPDGGLEFNTANDIHAANVLYRSSAALWQVPAPVYSSVRISQFELMDRVLPCGEIGKYLYENVVAVAHEEADGMKPENMSDEMKEAFKSILGETPAERATAFRGELWTLGDSPWIGLLLDNRLGRYTLRTAPWGVNTHGMFDFSKDTGHRIRVYDDIDGRFILEDFIAKLRWYFL